MLKKRIIFVMLLILLLTGCAAPARSQSVTPTSAPASPAKTGVPSAPGAATPTGVPTPTGVSTPTAAPLPTRVIEQAPTPLTGSAPEAPKTLMDEYLPGRVKVAETEHFIFYAKDGYFPVDQQWWTAQAEVIYAYVSARLDNAQVKNKIELGFMKPETRACPIRGLAAQGASPMILIYADQQSAQPYLLSVLAHEVGHAVSSQGFANGLPKDLALTEGLATWASGKYWAAWKNVPSLDDLIRQFISAGEYESIYENNDLHGVYPWQSSGGDGQDCLARRDRVYSEWGSFTGYLIQTYGWQKAYRLFDGKPPIEQDGKMVEFPPDYAGIYGKSLNQLEFEWLAWLKSNKSADPGLITVSFRRKLRVPETIFGENQKNSPRY